MAEIAVLKYNDNLYLHFDVYNERYEGQYPNLRYKVNVRVKFTGNFSIYAYNTIKMGGLSWSGNMSYPKWTNDSGWIGLNGEINELMYCNRQRSFQWDCSCSGWPNLSGKATLTTPKIAAPTFEASISDVDINSVTINGRLKTNPYNLYTLRVWTSSGSKFIINKLNGSSKVTGLTQNTNYEYHVEPFMADLSGNYIDQKVLKVKTLENYKEIQITNVAFVINQSNETYDNVTLSLSTSDDSHVSKVTWGAGGDYKTETGLTTQYTNLPKNTEYDMEVYVTDTLGRESQKYTFKFNTTFNHMEAWIFDGKKWKRGYSMQLQSKTNEYKYCRLYYFNGTFWKPAKIYK